MSNVFVSEATLTAEPTFVVGSFIVSTEYMVDTVTLYL
jgi:hypothetical protein